MGWIQPPITTQELQQWAAFERVEGPVLIHDRVETSLAIVALTAAAPHAAHAGRLTIQQFMPHWDAEAPNPNQQSPEEIMEAIRSMAVKDEETFYELPGAVHSEPSPRRRVE